MPSVLHNAWKGPGGELACAVANISGADQTFRIDMPGYDAEMHKLICQGTHFLRRKSA
jgi:hypothetical protein